MTDAQHLVQMANDIESFFRALPRSEASGIENHIRSFWTPRMRERLFLHLQSGDSGLDALPGKAVRRLRNNPHLKPKQPPGGDAG